MRKLRRPGSVLGKLDVVEVTLDVIDAIKAAKLKAACKPTVNRYLALVRAILLRSRDDWEWDRQGAKEKLFKEGSARERSITVAQAETLVSELPGASADVVVFALATGLRQSNVLGLEWSHVDLAAGHAWVGAGQSKNGKPIAVPLNAHAGGVATAAGQTSGCLPIPGNRLGVPTPWPGERPWTLRHRKFPLARLEAHLGLMASAIGNADARAAAARRLAASVMVERYAHLAPDHLAKAANRLDSLLGGYDLATPEKGSARNPLYSW